jgi:hypothetical protein
MTEAFIMSVDPPKTRVSDMTNEMISAIMRFRQKLINFSTVERLNGDPCCIFGPRALLHPLGGDINFCDLHLSRWEPASTSSSAKAQGNRNLLRDTWSVPVPVAANRVVALQLHPGGLRLRHTMNKLRTQLLIGQFGTTKEQHRDESTMVDEVSSVFSRCRRRLKFWGRAIGY